jgi:hypothetical protein
MNDQNSDNNYSFIINFVLFQVVKVLLEFKSTRIMMLLLGTGRLFVTVC